MRIKAKDGSIYAAKVGAGRVIEKAEGKPIVAVVNDESRDDDGDIIRQAGWEMERFNKAPRGFWMHDPFQMNIYTGGKAWVEKKELLFGPEFDQGDPDAMKIEGKYRRGALSEWSVGVKYLDYKPLNEDEGMTGGVESTRQLLREISPVNMGANENTATIMKSLIRMAPEAVDDQEREALTEKVDELADAQQEFRDRLAGIERLLMSGVRPGAEETEKQMEEVRAAEGRCMDALADIVALQD